MAQSKSSENGRWRPLTAVRAADGDGNRSTAGGRFSAAAGEASSSRVFAGVHFPFDLTAGRRLGRQVARFLGERLLLPVREQGGSAAGW